MTELAQRWVSGNTLALRPGEHLGYCSYFEWAEYDDKASHPYVYAVMLLRTPGLPGEAHPETKLCTVLCAQRHACKEGERAGESLWGWVHLDRDAKEHIGRDLEGMGVTRGAWFVLEVVPPALPKRVPEDVPIVEGFSLNDMAKAVECAEDKAK